MTFIIGKILQGLKRFADDLPRDLIRRGSALGLVLVFMTFMLILGTGLLTVGQYMVVQSRTVGEADSFYYAAESAAQLAAQLLMRQVSTAGADGTTSGALVETTTASVAHFSDLDDLDAIANDPVIAAMLESIIATLADIYSDIETTVESYPPGSSTPGFNGRAVELVELWMASTDGTYEHKIGDLLEAYEYEELLSTGVATVSGLYDEENYYTDDFGDNYYLMLAVFLQNPNFRIVARSGGRTVEVNTNVALDFSIGVDVFTTTATVGGTAPGRFANFLSNVTIHDDGSGNLNNTSFEVEISGDVLGDDKDEVEAILEEHLASGGVVHGVPRNVLITCGYENETTLEFIVTENNSGDKVSAKTGPIRITLPAEIFAGYDEFAATPALPLNVTRNDDAKWDIVGDDVGGGNGERLPGDNIIIPDENETGLPKEYKDFIDDKIAKSAEFATEKENFIKSGSVLSGSTITLGNGTYYEEYIDCENLTISRNTTPYFPNLKGIYVSNNMTVEYGSIFNGNQTNAYVGGKLLISTYLVNTTLNGCAFYADDIEIFYGGDACSFTSDSVFYPRSKLTVRGDTRVVDNTMPQFYVPEDAEFVFQMQILSVLPGCYFLQSDDPIISLAVGAQTGGLTGASGIFAGNFESMGTIDGLTPEELDDLLWDKDLIDFLNGGSGGNGGEPPAAAFIEGTPQIVGTVGDLITYVEFDVLIERDVIGIPAFGEGFEPREMLWNVPEGIEVECIKEDDTTLRFTVYGTPETPLSGPLDIIIPASIMHRDQAIDVAISEDAFWDIVGEEPTTETIRVATPSYMATSGNKGAGLRDVTGEPAV